MRAYDGKVGLSLLAGPANAGKVALLLDRYLARLDDEPTLIVPNASDVDRVERDLLARCGCLFSGTIGTFDDLFRRLAGADAYKRPLSDAERSLIVRRLLQSASLNGLSRSARTSGFADTLLQTLGELEQGLLDPSDLDGDLAQLYALYRAELDRLGRFDRDLLRRRAAERLGNTPAVARSSYVSPAVVEQYLDGRTIEDFRPRHLRVVGARDLGLDTEEQATLSLLRSWRIRSSRAAA